MSVEANLERFIIDELLLGYGETSIGVDDPLVSSRVLDSLALLRLIMFVEEEFGVEIDDYEVVPENFETIGRITEIIEGKKMGAKSTQDGAESR